MTSIAIVTPWYENEQLADDYFAAVKPELREHDELIIVDNASEPALSFATLRSETNLGFCGGSNLGLERARTDAVLFLNNDVSLRRSGWLNAVRDALEPGVLVGPLVFSRHTVVDDVEHPYIAGWCLAGLRDELLDLGGWDEELDEPAYYSDNILSLQARRAGMKLRDVRVGLVHYEGTTARLDPNIYSAAAANRQRYVDLVRTAVAAT